MGSSQSSHSSSSSSATPKSPRGKKCDFCDSSKVSARVTRTTLQKGKRLFWLCEYCTVEAASNFDRRGTVTLDVPGQDLQKKLNQLSQAELERIHQASATGGSAPSLATKIWSVKIGVDSACPSVQDLVSMAQVSKAGSGVSSTDGKLQVEQCLDLLSLSNSESQKLSEAVSKDGGGDENIGASQEQELKQVFTGGIIETNAQIREQSGMLQSTILVFEPCKSVGTDKEGLAVRASKNVAIALSHMVPTWRPCLVECWRHGVAEFSGRHNRLLLASSRLFVVEGGEQSIYSDDSFKQHSAAMKRSEWLQFCSNLLKSRGPSSPLGVYICLGHQSAFAGMLLLIREALGDIRRHCTSSSGDRTALSMSALETADAIEKMASALHIRRNGKVVAGSWLDDSFVVCANEEVEIGPRLLVPYAASSSSSVSFLPSGLGSEKQAECSLPTSVVRSLLEAHRATQEEFSSDLNLVVGGKERVITMFHGDEVTEESALFINYSFRMLSVLTRRHRSFIDCPELAHLADLPSAVEIVYSTEYPSRPGTPLTEVAAAAIYYATSSNHAAASPLVRRSFTMQFHPELQQDLREHTAKSRKKFTEQLNDMDGYHLLGSMLLSAAKSESAQAKQGRVKFY